MVAISAGATRGALQMTERLFAITRSSNPRPATGAAAASPAPDTVVSISARAQQLAAAPARSAVPVDYTNNVKLTGDKTIDPLLAAGNYWWHSGSLLADGANPSASANHTLTYSFRTDPSGLTGNDASGFQALSAAQKDVVRSAFDYISTVVNITFSEDSGGSGQLKIGSNNQGGSSAGYAYYPNSGSVGGSVFLANDQSTFTTASQWDAGGYEWQTIVHEIGHALGLKHPGNYNAGGGGTPGPYLSKTLDNRTNTIMSYNNDTAHMHIVESNGAGGLRAYNVNAESYQSFDITALQYLYGAPASAQTTYSLSDDRPFSRTIFNNNAASSIDLSGVTHASVLDLRGGHASSIGIIDPYASTGMDKATYAKMKLTKVLGTPTYSGANNLSIAKGSSIRTATGSSANDSFITGSEIGGTAQLDGAGGDDSYFIASGNAVITDTGGSSNDTVYILKKSGTAWSLSADLSTLTQTNSKTGATLSTVQLSGIEHVSFWSGKAMKAAGKPLLAPVAALDKVYAAAATPVAPRLHASA